ncbi:MAG: response regulator transcription factor [Cytophagales bacterium]|nr:response regulator transcription factor [Cytophagales bacterium]MDW8383300.1 response regulator transcription factor [Flammeovirgaceae bacterium]
MKILLIDDHRLFLDGIVEIFAKNEKLKTSQIFKSYSYHQVIQMLETQRVDLVICDINLPDNSGLNAIPVIKSLCPKAKILMLSIYNQPEIIQRAIRLGANGFINKDIEQKELLESIQIVMQGGLYLSEKTLKALEKETPHQEEELTKREIEILGCIIKEMSNAEIAEKLFISPRTVETHRKNILRKTNNHTVIGLIKYAYRKGISLE